MLLQNYGILKYFYLCHFLAEATIIFAEKKPMREQIRQQIETARQRLIKQRRLLRMKDFMKFRERVYDQAKRKFGEISEGIDRRLNIELEAILLYRRTLMLSTAALYIEDLDECGIYCRLQQNGYNASLVCYLLGISTFNPMKYPDLITEKYVLETYRALSVMSFKINKDNNSELERILEELDFKDLYSSTNSKPIRIESLNINTYRLKYTAADKSNSDFVFFFEYRHFLSQIRCLRREIGVYVFDNIPDNDPQTMILINSLDLYGTITYLDQITIEAIRRIQPKNISELAEALSFTKDIQFPLLEEYLLNKNSNNKIYSEDKVIDDILSHTKGVLLYSRQKEECMKRLNYLSNKSSNDYHKCNDFLSRQLLYANIEGKCDRFIKAHNMYRLAYAKVHFPEAFQKVIESNTNLK